MVFNLLSLPIKHTEMENQNAIVYAHCTIKGLQAGILLGSLSGTIVNLYNMYYKKTEKAFNWNRVGRYARNGIIPMILIINKMCYDRLSTSVIEKNQSRAWRIAKNQGQNISDDLTLGGVAGGLVAAALKGQKSAGSIFITASLGGLTGLLVDFAFVAGREMTNKH